MLLTWIRRLSALTVCVGESASRGMRLWLGASLPWRSAIWGDLTVRGPRSRTNKQRWKKNPGPGAAVNTRSVARLCIPPLIASMRAHIWMYMKHTDGKHTQGGTEQWRNSNNEDRMAKNHHNYHVDLPSRLNAAVLQDAKKKKNPKCKQRNPLSRAVTTREVMQMIVRGTVQSSTSGPPRLSGEP